MNGLQRSPWRPSLRPWPVPVMILLLLGCSHLGSHKPKKPGPQRPGKVEVQILDTNGLEPRPFEAVEPGDSLSVGFEGLAPGEQVEVFLEDDTGAEWSYARLYADRKGRIRPVLFWYQTGVIGTTLREIDFRPDPAFETFEEAEEHFARHRLTLRGRSGDGRVLLERPILFRPRTSPLVFPSNSRGVLVNAFDVAREGAFVTGKNLPPGATVHLYVVPNRHDWSVGDPLEDVTGPGGEARIETVELGSGQTSFTLEVWPRGEGRPGAYDVVARIADAPGEPRLRPGDVLTYNNDTGIILYAIINGNIVIDSAGRLRGAPAKFEFSDAFEKGEDVYAAVDPTDVPAVHSGGSYAEYVVIEDQSEAFYDGVSPTWTDVSGAREIHRVKYWCINASRRLVWPGATQTEPMKGYDLIVDFGSVPANDSASFVSDGTYTKGTDFVDGYDTVGFWVFEDPSAPGPFPVGQVVLDDPAGISGITDPMGATGPTYPVTLAWAKMVYPATAAGTGTPVHPGEPSYPVALFLHGRHADCDNDGAGPGLAGGVTFPPAVCPDANRIPSHEGYDYIMERLASQGIFSISISAHQIQHDNGIWNYDARGRLILKFLDKLRDWTDNGTDPFGAIFDGRLDMSRVALSGHSRGGEGVVAAQHLNLTWPTPHSIVAVNAIAPTDQNGASYLMTEAPYYLLVGARDGDVATMQGFRTYDRAYPDGMADREPKTVAWVHGANHNYFNTVWTDSAALGTPNPWAGSTDDGGSLTIDFEMSTADQRQIALTTIAAFFRRHFQGIEPYREIFTGRVEPAAIANQHVFWTYQDDERMAVDDFEQSPTDPSVNSLGGPVSAPGFTTFAERLLNFNGTDYTAPPPSDSSFFHDTLGLRLSWATPQTYTTELPAGARDVSAYSHLTLRLAKKVTGAPMAGPAVNLLVNVEDGSGSSALWDLRTDQFDVLPHPYVRSGGWCGACTNQAQLNGVRIPLRNFTQNNSGVDLTDIVRITVRTEGSGEIGIDDIEFGK